MTLMKRIKLKGLNDPSQNIAAWENELLLSKDPPSTFYTYWMGVT